MFEAFILGVIQGLTEFLPVSSSGHLLLFQQWLTIPGDPLLFDLAVHLATLLPVLWVYREDLLGILKAPLRERGTLAERPSTRLALLVGAATVPTGIIGLTFKDTFEAMFHEPSTLVITFTITGVLLFISGRVPQRGITLDQMTFQHALIIGLAQGLAITPGISRAGTTIAVALMLGLDRELAARFSFLLAIPAILGAFVLTARDVDPSHIQGDILIVGGVGALVAGYFALTLLVKLVKRGDFSRFCYYVWFMAIVAALST